MNINNSFLSKNPEKIGTVLELLEGSAALIGIYDNDEKLRFSNATFRKKYFIEANEEISWQELLRRNFDAKRGTIICTDDIDAWITSVRSRRGKNKVRTYESDLHDGSFIWVTETMLSNSWIIYVGTDITELKVSSRTVRLARDEAMRAATTDELTGVSNRRHILQHLEQMINEHGKIVETDYKNAHHYIGSACLIDIDHFKHINDTFGHTVGDTVLIAISQNARESIHLRDAFGRIGGEEFLILFPEQSAEQALTTVSKLKQKIATMAPIEETNNYKVTFSAGITNLKDTDTTTDVLIRCDRALYRAKKAGRNKIFTDYEIKG